MTKTIPTLRPAALAAAASLAFLAAAPATAQESSGGHTITLGLGAQTFSQ